MAGSSGLDFTKLSALSSGPSRDLALGLLTPSYSKKHDWSKLGALVANAGLSGGSVPGHENLFNRFIDVISRPFYATTNMVQGVGDIINNASENNLEAGDLLKPIQGIGAGLAGTEKGDYIKVLNHAQDVYQAQSHGYKAEDVDKYFAEHPEAKRESGNAAHSVVGTAMNLVLDPLNLVGVGEVKGLLKGAKAGVELLKGTDEVSDAAKVAEAATGPSKLLTEPGGIAAADEPMLPFPKISETSGIRDVEPSFGYPKTFAPVDRTTEQLDLFGATPETMPTTQVVDNGQGMFWPKADVRGGSAAQARLHMQDRGVEGLEPGVVPDETLPAFTYQGDPYKRALPEPIKPNPAAIVDDAPVAAAVPEPVAAPVETPPVQAVPEAGSVPDSPAIPEGNAIIPDGLESIVPFSDVPAMQRLLLGAPGGIKKLPNGQPVYRIAGPKAEIPLELKGGKVPPGRPTYTTPELAAWLRSPTPEFKGHNPKDIMVWDEAKEGTVSLTRLKSQFDKEVAKDRKAHEARYPSETASERVAAVTSLAKAMDKDSENVLDKFLLEHPGAAPVAKTTKAKGKAKATPKVVEETPVTTPAEVVEAISSPAIDPAKTEAIINRTMEINSPSPKRPLESPMENEVAIQAAARVTEEIKKGGYKSVGGKAVRSSEVPFKYNPNQQFDLLKRIHAWLADPKYYNGKRPAFGSSVHHWSTALNILEHVDTQLAKTGINGVIFGNKVTQHFRVTDAFTAIANDLGLKGGAAELLARSAVKGSPEAEVYEIIHKSAYAGQKVNGGLLVLAQKYPSLKGILSLSKGTDVLKQSYIMQKVAGTTADAVDKAVAASTGTPAARVAIADDVPKIVDTIAGDAASPEVTKVITETTKDDLKPVLFTDADKSVYARRETLADEALRGDVKVDTALDGAILRESGVTLHEDMRSLDPTGFLDRVMSRIATWWGHEPMHHYNLDVVQGTHVNAMHQNDTLVKALTPYTPEAIAAGFKLMTGRAVAGGTAGDEAVAKILSTHFGALFEDITVPQKYSHGNTVVFRSKLTTKEINAQLPGSGIKDFAMEGDTPMSSILKYEGKMPIEEFAQSLTYAVSKALVRKNIMHEASLLGKATGADPVHLYKLPYPELEDIRYTKEVAQQLRSLIKLTDEINLAPNTFLKSYDAVQNMWKVSVTKYRLGHHTNNYLGDLMLTWMAGHNPLNLRLHKQAVNVLRSHKDLYPELLPDASNMLDVLKAGRGELAAVSESGAQIGLKLKNKEIANADIFAFMENNGLLPRQYEINDLLTATNPVQEKLGKIKPFRGKVSSAVSKGTEVYDHEQRIYHFLAAAKRVDKKMPISGMSPEARTEKVFNQALSEVRRWHPDGRDMTAWERKYPRRLMPFYMWTRKATPLILSGILNDPAKLLFMPKLGYGISDATGNNPTSISQPMGDLNLPDFLRNSSFGAAGAMAIGGNLPINDIQRWMGDPANQAGGMLSPLIKAPVELATGSRFGTKTPIGDTTQYLDSTFGGPVAAAGRVTGQDLGLGTLESVVTGDPQEAQLKITQKGNFDSTAPILNWLTGLSFSDTNRADFQRIANQDAAARRRAALEQKKAGK